MMSQKSKDPNADNIKVANNVNTVKPKTKWTKHNQSNSETKHETSKAMQGTVGLVMKVMALLGTL
jgi:hypothetical protein